MADRSTASSDAPRYHADEWRTRARLELGHSPHAVAGALADAKPDKTFSAEEVQSRVEKWLDRKVPEEDR